MERRIKVLGVLLVIALVLIGLYASWKVTRPSSASRSSWGTDHPFGTLQEDDPRWDCRVHGNRICGEVNPHGQFELIYYPEGWTL